MHTIVEAGESKVCRAGQQAGDKGKLKLQLESDNGLEAESHFPVVTSVFSS